VDFDELISEADTSPTRRSAEAEERDTAAWGMQKLIELVDEAIDRAGAQLARSAGLWANSPSPFVDEGRPVRGRRPQSSPTHSLLEAMDRDQGMSPT
jgi:hypothetical protein